MKKVLIALTVIGLAGLTSCGGGSAADIKVEDLTDACGCAEAMETVADEVLDMGIENEDDMTEEQEKEIETLFDKFDEIEDHCKDEIKIKKSDMKECGNWDSLNEKMGKVEDVF